jgi:uncharacterized membrane protein YphA (DoxX/SURF4 family)
MKLPVKARELPLRITTGAYILHAGLDKWEVEEAHAAAVHGMAAGAFPMLKDIPPARFVRLLAAGEIATGTALLTPFVPTAVAGAALTGFSAALVTLYGRTPTLRKPGSIWPSQQGTGVSKDVWMLGIGLGLLVDGLTRRRER